MLPLCGENMGDEHYCMWSVDPRPNVDFCTGQPVSSALTLLCLEMPVVIYSSLVFSFAAVPAYTLFGYMSSHV